MFFNNSIASLMCVFCRTVYFQYSKNINRRNFSISIRFYNFTLMKLLKEGEDSNVVPNLGHIVQICLPNRDNRPYFSQNLIIIVRLLNFQKNQNIISFTRKKNQITSHNSRLFFVSDFFYHILHEFVKSFNTLIRTSTVGLDTLEIRLQTFHFRHFDASFQFFGIILCVIE